jgi:uncharacterized protein with PQ loop repeat
MVEQILIENALIIAGEAFFLSSSYSQLRKLIKTRNTKGLYAPTAALNASGNVAWMTYFTSQRLWIPLSTNFAMFVLTMITMGYLLANKKQFLKALISILILGPITAFLIIVYPNFSGWTGMIFNTIASTPWLIHVIRTKKVSGLSERSLYLSTGAMSCVLAYGILVKSAPLIAGCVQGLVYMLIVASYYYFYRSKDVQVLKKV